MCITSCKNNGIKEVANRSNSVYLAMNKKDSLSLSNAIHLFKKTEKATMDSINFYHLNDISDSCLKYLYVIYGMEKFSDNLWCKSNQLSIGECKISATDFINIGKMRKEIIFDVFLKDSIPCTVHQKASKRKFPGGFTVDIEKRKIVNALIGESEWINWKDFVKIYDSVRASERFRIYIHDSGINLHPVYQRLISSPAN